MKHVTLITMLLTLATVTQPKLFRSTTLIVPDIFKNLLKFDARPVQTAINAVQDIATQQVTAVGTKLLLIGAAAGFAEGLVLGSALTYYLCEHAAYKQNPNGYWPGAKALLAATIGTLAVAAGCVVAKNNIKITQLT